jgi:hypothetical protein
VSDQVSPRNRELVLVQGGHVVVELDSVTGPGSSPESWLADRDLDVGVCAAQLGQLPRDGGAAAAPVVLPVRATRQ